MVSMRVFCYLLISFIFQVHAKVSNANPNSQVTEAAYSKSVGARTSMQIADKVSGDVIKHRKVLLNQINVKVEAKKKSGLEIESKETVRKRYNKKKKKLPKTLSLTADYSNPGHHPPRHN